MKTIFILVTMLAALLLSGCSLFEDKEIALEIVRLQTELASQHGARAAEIEYGERQVSFYLGCKEFFNRCSNETIERGQKLLEKGFTGTTSFWYWTGVLGQLTCIAIAFSIFVTMFLYLYLIFIAPKAEAVEQAQRLVDGVDSYIEVGRKWRAAHEEKLFTTKSALKDAISEIKNQKKERDEVWRTLTEIHAELASAKAQLTASQQQKIDTAVWGDY
jgi:CBS domain containing-hemolysin-like protein